MVGIQIELKNLEKGAKPKIVRFEAQESDEANEEDLITSAVRGSPEPTKQCEHI